MPIKTWLESCHTRLFPTGNTPGAPPSLDAARNQTVAIQVAATFEPHTLGSPETVQITVRCQEPKGTSVRIRRVGFVPVPHHNTGGAEPEWDCVGRIPGYVPDPLFDEQGARIGAGETAVFWLTVSVERDAPVGQRAVPVTVTADGKEVRTLRARLRVWDVVLAPRRGLPVTHWFYADALLDWYRLQAFEERFWAMLKSYVEDCVSHAQDTLYVPMLTPPLDGVKRPTQLLGVHPATKGDRKYRFDWSDVKRYVDLARRAGIRHFEWTHFFTQWGAAHAIRVYRGQGRDERLLWKPLTAATSPTYRAFLSELLPELERFLRHEGILERSFFHVSDEPHGTEHKENYRRARALLAKLAPWMRVMDALSEIEYGRERLTDMPIPSIRVTRQFVEEGIPCWTYFCCGPRGPYLNRLMDSPLAKIRMAGWLFYRFGVRGFLHWGYNYWYKSQSRELIDPYCESSGLRWPGWAYGDPFVVYPGAAGPVDSIRWEVWAAGLVDYALLQQSDIDADAPLLQPLEDFHRFPKDERWVHRSRRALLARLAGR